MKIPNKNWNFNFLYVPYKNQILDGPLVCFSRILRWEYRISWRNGWRDFGSFLVHKRIWACSCMDGCEDSEVQTFSVELGEGGTLRGVVDSEFWKWFTCLFETELVGFGEPQTGDTAFTQGFEWGFGWLQTNHELGEIVEYLATVAILLGVPFRGNSKIPGKKGLPTDVPQPLRQVVCLWGQTK